MIWSILDSDLYKFSMQQVVFHRFTHLDAKYKMIFRNREQGMFMREHWEEFFVILEKLRGLKLSVSEREFMEQLGFFSKDYLDFLGDFRFNPDYITMVKDRDDLQIIIEGPWLQTILFEVPVLAIACELLSRKFAKNLYDMTSEYMVKKIKSNFINKLKKSKSNGVINFAEFGTRRRYGYAHQEDVIKTLASAKLGKKVRFVGTSNVHFAHTYGLIPIGTMAHEYLQAMQYMAPLWDSQKYALQVWSEEYRGDLGIALTDVIGMDAFLRDFDLYFAKLFEGLRHDSGDPIEWGHKAIQHYLKLGIDPRGKTLVFSDGLDAETILKIQREFDGHINLSYGVGTNLSNGEGTPVKPNVVLKLIEINGRPVAKISDEPGKTMCEDAVYFEYLKKVFSV